MDNAARHRTLMNSVGAGDATAFAEIYDDLCADTYAICVHHLGDTSMAQLTMIDIWLDVWENANSLVYREGVPDGKILATAEDLAQSRLKVLIATGA